MQMTRKSPTPTETVMMSTVVLMCGTLEASTLQVRLRHGDGDAKHETYNAV